MTLHLEALHNNDKPVSMSSLLGGAKAKCTAIRLQAGHAMKPHSAPAAAMLLCISGRAEFRYMGGEALTLEPGAYVPIRPREQHVVTGLTDCQLILMIEVRTPAFPD